MPHVTVKLWPGQSERQKKHLAERIAKDVMDVLDYGDESVSVAIEEIASEEWAEKVYRPEIGGKRGQLLQETRIHDVNEAKETSVATRLTRRTLLASALAGAAVPHLALGQTQPERAIMKIECAFGSHVFTASLYDNPSARDLASMLPLEITIDDYSNNEKIAYLPRKLTEQGTGPFTNEAPGDLCYYAPWGNLAFFYAGYRFSRGLIRLGRLDSGFEPLLTRGKFPLRITRLRSNP